MCLDDPHLSFSDVQEPVTCQQKDKIVEEDVSSVSSVAQDQQSCVVSGTLTHTHLMHISCTSHAHLMHISSTSVHYQYMYMLVCMVRSHIHSLDGQETSPVEKVRMGGNISSAVPHTAPVEKVRMGGNTSSAVPHTAPVEKVRIGGNTSSAVPREQQSRFKTGTLNICMHAISTLISTRTCTIQMMLSSHLLCL